MYTRIPSTLFLALLFAFLCLQGCASFLQLGEPEGDPAEYDRGYSRDAEMGEDSTAESQAYDRDTSSNTADELSYEQRRIKRAIETRDVILGMTRNDVAASWGTPAQREVAGRGNGGHERWTYGSRFSLSGPRTVIFEGGRVAGWSQ